MVLTKYLPPSNNENVSESVSVPRGRHNTHTRRQRYRFQNTSLNPSSRRVQHMATTTREPYTAHHRSTHATPAGLHRPLGHGLARQDVDAFDELPPAHAHAQRNTALPQLPRHLRRAAFRRVSPAAIAAIEPELKDVAVEFIQQKIRNLDERMFTSASQVATRCPKGRLPRELEVLINDVSVSTPTHLFAVYSQPSALQKQRIALHAAHALVLVANCAHLPPLPYSKPDTPQYPGTAIFLPVIPLALQSPETFPILLEYLYTQRGDTLLRSLLPLPSKSAAALPTDQLTKMVATTCSATTIQAHLCRVYGLWSNVTALGVFDEGLWRIMEVAWGVLQDTLQDGPGDCQ